MIVRNVGDLDDTDRDIKTPNWRSKRVVLAKEGVLEHAPNAPRNGDTHYGAVALTASF